jgi:predicted RNase H-like HicB family nuclease
VRIYRFSVIIEKDRDGYFAFVLSLRDADLTVEEFKELMR